MAGFVILAPLAFAMRKIVQMQTANKLCKMVIFIFGNKKNYKWAHTSKFMSATLMSVSRVVFWRQTATYTIYIFTAI